MSPCVNTIIIMKTVNWVRTDRDPVRPLELSRWQKVIFPLILWSVHQVLNVCTSLWLRICHLWKLCMDLSLPKSTFTQIVAATKMNLTKVPSHIAFGFLERDTNVTMEKVARLVSVVNQKKSYSCRLMKC